MSNILIVDHDLDLCQNFSDGLRYAGHHVSMVHTGADALKLLSQIKPDVVVLDMNLISIKAILSFINKWSWLHLGHTKVIVVSGYPNKAMPTVQQWGADAYLVKPISINELEVLIKTFEDKKDTDATLVKQPHLQRCPRCETAYQLGEPHCPHCGLSFNIGGKTSKMDKPQFPHAHKNWKLKARPLAYQNILFEIDEESFILPRTKIAIVGRTHAANTVDLSRFDAANKGVSRHHLQISRSLFIYVTDLISTNGSFLNGQRLLPNLEYALNDGDELWLGQLKIAVKFQ